MVREKMGGGGRGEACGRSRDEVEDGQEGLEVKDERRERELVRWSGRRETEAPEGSGSHARPEWDLAVCVTCVTWGAQARPEGV